MNVINLLRIESVLKQHLTFEKVLQYVPSYSKEAKEQRLLATTNKLVNVLL